MKGPARVALAPCAALVDSGTTGDAGRRPGRSCLPAAARAWSAERVRGRGTGTRRGRGRRLRGSKLRAARAATAGWSAWPVGLGLGLGLEAPGLQPANVHERLGGLRVHTVVRIWAEPGGMLRVVWPLSPPAFERV